MPLLPGVKTTETKKAHAKEQKSLSSQRVRGQRVTSKPKGVLVGDVPFDVAQTALLRKASWLPHVALISQATGQLGGHGGYVSVDLPPHANKLFAHGDTARLAIQGVFALPKSGKGQIVSLGAGAYLNLCETRPKDGDEPASPLSPKPHGICAGGPTALKRVKAAPHGEATKSHHRKLLLSETPTAEFVVEIVG